MAFFYELGYNMTKEATSLEEIMTAAEKELLTKRLERSLAGYEKLYETAKKQFPLLRANLKKWRLAALAGIPAALGVGALGTYAAMPKHKSLKEKLFG